MKHTQIAIDNKYNGGSELFNFLVRITRKHIASLRRANMLREKEVDNPIRALFGDKNCKPDVMNPPVKATKEERAEYRWDNSRRNPINREC